MANRHHLSGPQFTSTRYSPTSSIYDGPYPPSESSIYATGNSGSLGSSYQGSNLGSRSPSSENYVMPRESNSNRLQSPSQTFYSARDQTSNTSSSPILQENPHTGYGFRARFRVHFPQPFENLFDQFDKDPSVQAMVNRNAFVGTHFQSRTYANSRATQPTYYESCSSSITSSDLDWPESVPEDKVQKKKSALAPFSKASPDPIRSSRKYRMDHWTTDDGSRFF